MFRSYQPESEVLKEDALPEAAPGDVSEHVKEEIAKENQGIVINELDFISLAPRKPDWDLKRDIAKKLEKLDKRTARAIGEIIRERLKAETEDDLASAVQAGASYAAASTEDE